MYRQALLTHHHIHRYYQSPSDYIMGLLWSRDDPFHFVAPSGASGLNVLLAMNVPSMVTGPKSFFMVEGAFTLM